MIGFNSRARLVAKLCVPLAMSAALTGCDPTGAVASVAGAAVGAAVVSPLTNLALEDVEVCFNNSVQDGCNSSADVFQANTTCAALGVPEESILDLVGINGNTGHACYITITTLTGS